MHTPPIRRTEASQITYNMSDWDETGSHLGTLTQCASPFFQRTRKNMSSCSFRVHGNVTKRARKSPTISIRTLQFPRSGLFVVMKIMGCSARGWGWPVENFNNRISKIKRVCLVSHFGRWRARERSKGMASSHNSEAGECAASVQLFF